MVGMLGLFWPDLGKENVLEIIFVDELDVIFFIE